MIDIHKLTTIAIANAYQAFADGQYAKAMDWLQVTPPEQRPKDLECNIAHSAAKVALSKKQWGKAIEHFEFVCSKETNTLVQRRLSLSRKRKPLLGDNNWMTMKSSIDTAERLKKNQLMPEIEGVWACGAYYSRGINKSAPWSKFLRMNKLPHDLDPDERDAALRLSSSYLCRFIHDDTNLLDYVDVVVAIPPNPYRYVNRGWSLPDRLALEIEAQLALPYERYALELVDTELEMKALSPSERRSRIRNAICTKKIGLAKGRQVLLVDDVITSGATMKEAARQLKKSGVLSVYAIALCHTEG